jgi:hypothetical protein
MSEGQEVTASIESAQSSQVAPATSSSSTGSGQDTASAPSQSSAADMMAKLQGSDRQATSLFPDGSQPKPKEQVPQAPSDPAKAVENAQPANNAPAAPVFDPAQAEWLKSKGIDPSTPDYSKLIANAQAAEKEVGRIRAQKESEKAILDSKTIQDAALPPDVKTPLDEFEEAHSFELQQRLDWLGLESTEQLLETNPALYHQLSAAYIESRQKAWERTEQWKVEQQNARIEQMRKENEFKENMTRAEQTTRENFLEVKKQYPEFEDHLKATGAEDLVKHLEDTYTIPKEWLFSNPETVKWFARAAKAIDLMSNIEKHDDTVRAKYDESLRKQKTAALPSATSGQGNNQKSQFATANARYGGVSLLD